MAIAGALAPLIFLGKLFPAAAPVPSASRWRSSYRFWSRERFGWFNGWLVTRLRIQPIIATLVLFIAGRGIAQVLTNGNLQVFNLPEIPVHRPRDASSAFPFQAILMIVIVALAAWMLRRTVFGRQILAIGGNERAARLAGIPVASGEAAGLPHQRAAFRASPVSS